jgi:hypothetical protein
LAAGKPFAFVRINVMTEAIPFTPWDAPPPVLLNSSKHHAGALRHRIHEAGQAGPAGLRRLAGQLVVVGTELMDLYVGQLTPRAIGEGLIQRLDEAGQLDRRAYESWLQTQGGFGMLPLAEDGSVWVLRLGEEAGRYVHIHPARRAPKTLRVRANVLKTAVMVLAHVEANGDDPWDLGVVNAVRRLYLGLSPLGKLASGGEGIGALVEVLAGEGARKK